MVFNANLILIPPLIIVSCQLLCLVSHWKVNRHHISRNWVVQICACHYNLRWNLMGDEIFSNWRSSFIKLICASAMRFRGGGSFCNRRSNYVALSANVTVLVCQFLLSHYRIPVIQLQANCLSIMQLCDYSLFAFTSPFSNLAHALIIMLSHLF